METEITNEKQDSVKLIKNSKGYNWQIKRYYNYNETKPEEVIKQLQDIDKELGRKFGGNNG